jgi:hypothetical protein
MIPPPGSVMRIPFAEPPGRRGVWVRFAPEWCALAIVAVGLLVYALPGLSPQCEVLWRLPEKLGLVPGQVLAEVDRRSGGLFRFPTPSFIAAVALAQGLVVLALLFLATVTVAGSLAAERERGTLEPLLLTPLHHRLMIRGRFWHLAWPWLRLALYALPLYLAFPLRELATGGPPVSIHSGCAEPWSLKWQGFLVDRLCNTYAIGPYSLAGWFMQPTPAGSAEGWLISGLRWLGDLSAVIFAAGAAFFVSSRAKTVRTATWLSCLVAPAALLTVLSPDAWWAVVAAVQLRTRAGACLDSRSYWLMAMGLMAARLIAGLWLVARVADTFEAVAVGERPASAEEQRRRRPRPPRLRGAGSAGCR